MSQIKRILKLIDSFESIYYTDKNNGSNESNVMYYPVAESNTLELKVELPRFDQIVKTVIGFCNLHGGKVVIGVANDRKIVGLPEASIEACMDSIWDSIYKACVPHILPRVYAQRIEDKTIVIVEVSEGMNKPYFRRSEGVEKGVYVRVGSHTVHATEALIEELKWQSRGLDFECLPAYRATLDDLDLNAVQKFLDNRKTDSVYKVDESILRVYNIIAFDQSQSYPSMLGLLLFGKKPQSYLSEAMIICSHFKGVEGREAIATVDCEGTLFSQFEQAYAFITERIYHSFSIQSLKRKTQPEIPTEAIREALLNAIVHRNYYIKAPTKIAIYDDRVEIFSPGAFPGIISAENLCAGITYLRNPAICKILREAGYVEKLGSGFITIFSSYQKRGLQPPQVIEGDDFVKCILPRGVKLAQPQADNDEQAILDLFVMHDNITVHHITQKFAISRQTALRRVKKLIDAGLLEKIGETKNTHYRRRVVKPQK